MPISAMGQSSQRPAGQVVGGIVNSTEQGAALRVDAIGNLITTPAPGSTVSVNIASSGGIAVPYTSLGGATVVVGGATSGTVPLGAPVLGAGSDGTNVRTVSVDSLGRSITVGAATSGTAVSGSPVLSGISDGTNVRSATGDSSGRAIVVGAATAGTATAGSPVLTGSTDGTNARSRLSDASGRTIVVGAATADTAETASPVLTAGSDGTNVRTIETDSIGRSVIVGAVTAGTAVIDRPVTVGGSDGTNARTASTDSSGRFAIVGAATSGTAVVDRPVIAGASDGTNARSLLSDSSGRLAVVGAVTGGTAIVDRPVTIGGSDGTNARSLSTDSSGRVVIVGAATDGTTTINRPVLMGGQDGTNVQSLLTDVTGVLSGNIAQVAGQTTATNGSGVLAVAGATSAGLIIQGSSGGVAVQVNFTTANIATNVAQINAVTPLMGNGVTGTGSQRVTLASDGTTPTNVTDGTTDQASATIGLMENAAGNTRLIGTVGGISYRTTLPTLTNNQADLAQGTVRGIPMVTPAPDVRGEAATSVAMTSTLGATVFAIKGSAGNLYGYQAFNGAGTACFIQIFNVAAASVNLGTTVPIIVIGMPTVAQVDSRSDIPMNNFSTAISAASTTTALGSTTCGTVTVANFFYQ